MDLTKLLAGGAIIGLIAGFWNYIKAVLWRAANLFVQRVEINSEYAHNALVSYLIAHYRRSGLYDRMFGAWHEHRRDGQYSLVAYETFGNRNMVFWNGWLPFLFRNEVENKAGRATGADAAASSGTKIFSTVTYLRGTLSIERILTEACTHNDRLTWDSAADQDAALRFAIHYIPTRGKEEAQMEHAGSSSGLPWYHQQAYRLLGYLPHQLGKGLSHAGRALDHLIFPQRIKNLIREVELWRSSRDWYRQRGIPWKRGWVLYGPPGTGKTALARAFAQDLNMPIYVFNLAELSNQELQKAWNDMQKTVPCVALWEDFDNVFHGRENIARRPGLMPLMLNAPKDGEESTGPRPMGMLTFDCVLNCLDGVEKSDGVFTIITTNDITKIDPALGQPRQQSDGSVEFISTRPGRLDKAVELTYMEAEDKILLARRILDDCPDELAQMLDQIERMADPKETPAQVQERCAQIALAAFWKKQQEKAESIPFEGKEEAETRRGVG